MFTQQAIVTQIHFIFFFSHMWPTSDFFMPVWIQIFPAKNENGQNLYALLNLLMETSVVISGYAN